MYCKLCELRLRRGLRPDPACLECRHLAARAEAKRYAKIELTPKKSAVTRPPTMRFFEPSERAPISRPGAPERPSAPSDRLRGHLVCSRCRRLTLPSAARAAEDRVFCESCYARLPLCRSCGERVISESEGGSVLCPTCRVNTSACERCGEMLLPDEVYRCDGTVLCVGCYDALDECDRCGSKVYLFDENALSLLCSECKTSHAVCELCGAIDEIEAMESAEGHTVCAACYERLDECEDCGETVFAHPDDPSRVRLCAACLDSYVPCDLCREPIPLEESDRYIVDDRVLCENCYDDLPECEECYLHFFPDPKEERGNTVCAVCRDRFTTCDRCGKRLCFTDAYEFDGQLLCDACNGSVGRR